MNPKRHKLQEQLTEGLIHREYQVMFPEMKATIHEDAIHRYQMDSYFHARVDSLVAGVMDLVDKYAEFPEWKGDTP